MEVRMGSPRHPGEKRSRGQVLWENVGSLSGKAVGHWAPEGQHLCCVGGWRTGAAAQTGSRKYANCREPEPSGRASYLAFEADSSEGLPSKDCRISVYERASIIVLKLPFYSKYGVQIEDRFHLGEMWGSVGKGYLWL